MPNMERKSRIRYLNKRINKLKFSVTNPIIAENTGIFYMDTGVIAVIHEGTLTNPLLIASTTSRSYPHLAVLVSNP